MKLKGAIFDVDGTLFDSMGMWATAASRYLKSQGITPPEGIDSKFITLSLAEGSKLIKNEFLPQLTWEQIAQGINDLIEDFYFNLHETKPGVPELLKALSDAGVSMCIATATDKYLVRKALDNCGILKYFGEIFTCPDLGVGKDTPHIYRTALDFLGTERENTLIFEDSYFATKTAFNDGFMIAAVEDKWAMKHKDEIKAISKYYITSYDEWRKNNL